MRRVLRRSINRRVLLAACHLAPVLACWTCAFAGDAGQRAEPRDVLKAPPFYQDKLHLLIFIDEAGSPHPVTTKEQWQTRRAHIRENMQLVMGRMPGDAARVDLDVQVLEEVVHPNYIQRKIRYTAEPGDAVPAYLLVPRKRAGKVPGVICLHQTVAAGKGEPAGLDGHPDLHYARELAERGYVTLAPDYPRFADYTIDVYELGWPSVTGKGVWNHMRGIDLLQSLDEVDGQRIGCIGHSLGGHNAVFLAALDDRVKATVSSCGFSSFPTYAGGRIQPWGSRHHYMPRIAERYDSDPAKVPFDFTEVLAAIAPRSVFINAPTNDMFPVPGVQDCVNAATPVYELYGATAHLVVVHPEGGHGFPGEVREQAYAFIDRALKDRSVAENGQE